MIFLKKGYVHDRAEDLEREQDSGPVCAEPGTVLEPEAERGEGQLQGGEVPGQGCENHDEHQAELPAGDREGPDERGVEGLGGCGG